MQFHETGIFESQLFILFEIMQIYNFMIIFLFFKKLGKWKFLVITGLWHLKGTKIF